MAVHNNELPGEFHPDPADRLQVAMARIGNYTLVTRDRKILDYGKAGNVNVLPPDSGAHIKTSCAALPITKCS